MRPRQHKQAVIHVMQSFRISSGALFFSIFRHLKTLRMLPKFIFSILLSIVCTYTATAQLNGTALLSGQSNHAGIKIVFVTPANIPVDSCITNATGNFSITSVNGYYKARASFAGYQTLYFLNGGTSSLTNTTVLGPLTLPTGTAVYVSGNQSGYWTNDKTYYVENSVLVPANGILNIQPGTTIKFLGFSGIYVQGFLNAVGTPASPILFTSIEPGVSEWDKLFYNGAPANIAYCILEYSSNGLHVMGSGYTIQHNIFRYNSFNNVNIQATATEVSDNEIHHFSTYGISTEYNSTTTISCNHIYNDSMSIYFSRGISTQTSNLVHSNHIHNLKVGIEITGYGNPVVKNNFIHDNDYGIHLGSFNDLDSVITITNNTLVHNRQFCLSGFYPPPASRFINNLVVGSDTAIFMNDSIHCDHNLFFGCQANFAKLLHLPGAGVIVGNNANGDPVDKYGNLFKDPLFLGNQAPLLQSTSPAFHAGNTIFGFNMGADPQSACFTATTTGLSSSSENAETFKLFPNPTQDACFITLNSPAQIFIYDGLGQLQLSATYEKGTHAIAVKNLQPGMYALLITTKTGTSSAKLIKE